MSADIHLGFEVGTGEPVAIPAGHMAVTGQTQQAGKTTALEALISRSGCRAIAFVTKRGEASFADGRRIQPYFRDRVDWQFVESILESVMQQKMRFERAWIVRASKGAKTLSAVQFNVRKLMDESRGLSADVYMLLDQYLSLVVPLLKQLPAATSIELCPGLNVMDLSGYPMQVQGLVIRSTLEWVYEHERDVVTVIPEAWEFIPESRGSPVKLAAEALVRKGAALRNFAWIDSQDMAGVAKVLLRAASVWLIGVQREHNEVARALKHIPAGIKKPKPEDVSSLKLGQFWACWHGRTVKAYVQPAWMGDQQAREIAKRDAVPAGFARAPVRPTAPPVPRKPESDAENGEECSMDSDLKRLLEQQARATQALLERFAANGAAAPTPAEPAAAVVAGDEE